MGREQVVKLLVEHEEMTYQDLEDHMSISGACIRDIVARMRRLPLGHPYRVYIAAWRYRVGQPKKVFGLNPYLPDAPRPKTISNNEASARYRARHRAKLQAKRQGLQRAKIGLWVGLIKPTAGNRSGVIQDERNRVL